MSSWLVVRPKDAQSRRVAGTEDPLKILRGTWPERLRRRWLEYAAWAWERSCIRLSQTDPVKDVASLSGQRVVLSEGAPADVQHAIYCLLCVEALAKRGRNHCKAHERAGYRGMVRAKSLLTYLHSAARVARCLACATKTNESCREISQRNSGGRMLETKCERARVYCAPRNFLRFVRPAKIDQENREITQRVHDVRVSGTKVCPPNP